jgi:hypothetical protein
MTDQEIKVKALELTIQLVSLMPEERRREQLQLGTPTQVIIDLSHDFQSYLKNQR